MLADRPGERTGALDRRVLLLLVVVFTTPTSARAVYTTSFVTGEGGAGRFPFVADGHAAPLYVSSDDHAGVLRVLKHLQADIFQVSTTESAIVVDGEPNAGAVVLVGTIGHSPLIDRLIRAGKLNVAGVAGRWEVSLVQVVEQPFAGVEQALVIAGSDKRGTIYGMYGLAAQIGVSPWNWWADVPAVQQTTLYVLPGRHTWGEPEVKYRGIFINDEAPALAGWAQEKFGGCNHEFYEKVFELILRLKGNLLWPAMWGRAIYDDDPISPELADEYGVVIGTSHHEPLMRAHVEWSRYGTGPWNYEANEARLRQFWEEGIRRMGDNESIVTVGMRGDGDMPMSQTANIALLERIVEDQRKIIAKVTKNEPNATPQIWALYKEVQDYYDKGMRVPDDITLLLCDDNWGNIRKLPKTTDLPRAGGYGIYYHYDYVGDPRNYKWLNTNQISRVWEQMHLAYRHGVDRIWIVNVGDIKPMELPIEFFLDFAWDPDQWPAARLPEFTRLWAAQQFGGEHAAAIAEILSEYTRFNSRRKPELLSPETYSLTNYREADTVVAAYNRLAERAQQIYDSLPSEYRDAYFQLVLFPVKACANLNELYVAAGRNRLYAEQGRAATNELAKRVQQLFERDAELCRYYNQDMAGGKWNHMMDQTHIGYAYWQQPPNNNMPKVQEINLPQAAEMGVALEESESWWPAAEHELVLPEMSPYSKISERYIEVFNRGQSSFQFHAKADQPWVIIAPAEGTVEDQQRLAVSVLWDQVPAGVRKVPITITDPQQNKATVHAVINHPKAAGEADFHGFVEADGYVSIEAEHYSRAFNVAPIHWQLIPELGRTISAMASMPVTAAKQSPGGDAARLEYDVHLFSSGEVKVRAYVSPTLDFHDTDGLEYAISFNGEPPQVVNIHADRSHPAWQETVRNNVNLSVSKHWLSEPGPQTLKFWTVDAGVVLQKLVIDTGGVVSSYLGPPESHLAP